jgi:hypothetical protein
VCASAPFVVSVCRYLQSGQQQRQPVAATVVAAAAPVANSPHNAAANPRIFVFIVVILSARSGLSVTEHPSRDRGYGL